MIDLIELLKRNDIRHEIIKNFRPEHKVFLYSICSDLKYAYLKKYRLDMTLVLQNAIEDNNINIIDHIYSNKLLKSYSNIDRLIIKYDKPDVFDYLEMKKISLDKDDILFEAIMLNNLKTIEYLCSKNYPISKEKLQQLVTHKDISTDAFGILYKHDYFKNNMCCMYGCIRVNSNVRLLQYLINVGHEIYVNEFLIADPQNILEIYLNNNTEIVLKTKIKNPNNQIIVNGKPLNMVTFEKSIIQPNKYKIGKTETDNLEKIPLLYFIHLFRSGYYTSGVTEPNKVGLKYMILCTISIYYDRLDIVQYLLQNDYGFNIASFIQMYLQEEGNFGPRIRKYLDKNCVIVKAKYKYRELLNYV